MKKIVAIALVVIALMTFVAPRTHTEDVVVRDCTNNVITVITEDGNMYQAVGYTEASHLTAVFEGDEFIGFEEKTF